MGENEGKNGKMGQKRENEAKKVENEAKRGKMGQNGGK